MWLVNFFPKRKWSRQLRPHWQTGNKRKTAPVKRVFPYGPLLIWLHSRCPSKMYTSSTSTASPFSHCNKEVKLGEKRKETKTLGTRPEMVNSPLWKMIVKRNFFCWAKERKTSWDNKMADETAGYLQSIGSADAIKWNRKDVDNPRPGVSLFALLHFQLPNEIDWTGRSQ